MIHEVIHGFITGSKGINRFAVHKSLVFIGNISVFYQFDHGRAEHFGKNTQIVFVGQFASNRRGQTAYAKLDGGPVRDERDNLI